MAWCRCLTGDRCLDRRRDLGAKLVVRLPRAIGKALAPLGLTDPIDEVGTSPIKDAGVLVLRYLGRFDRLM